MELQQETVELESPSKRSFRRPWCALFSAVIPGAGDLFLGRRRRGILFVLIFVALLLCFGALRVPRVFWLLIVLAPTSFILSITSSCVTLVSGRTKRDAASAWWIILLVPAAAFFCATETGLAMKLTGLHAYNVPSTSMSPTIDAEDKIMVDMRYFHKRTPERGEVIVFRHGDIYLVKRVIGVGGDIVTGRNGVIELNGRALDELYAVHRTPQEAADILNNFGPVKVPASQLFVVGDNRDQSFDSRTTSGLGDFGPVYVTDVVGKPLYRYSSHASSDHDGQQIR
jgi:signal peptidase I